MSDFININDQIFEGDFEIIDTSKKKLKKEEVQSKRNLIIKKKYQQAQFVKLKNLSGFKMPGKNQFYYIITQNAFNAFTFIPHILLSEEIKTIYFSTFNLSKSVVLALCDYLEVGKISKAFIIINKILKYEHDEVIRLLQHYSKEYNLTFKMVHNHSKINCIKTKDNHYIISGSGNFSQNAYIEQYIINNDKKLFTQITNYLELI